MPHHLTVILPAAVSIVGIVCTAGVSLYSIRQQSRVLKRDARAAAMNDFCLRIAEWMHDPTVERWTGMTVEFWQVRLWLTNTQAHEIRNLIDAYKGKPAKVGGEFQAPATVPKSLRGVASATTAALLE